MPAKLLIVQKTAQKKLLKLPLKVHRRIVETLDLIQNDPLIGPKLRGELENYHKLRIGDYRIVYKFDSKKRQIEIVNIEHRQGVYK